MLLETLRSRFFGSSRRLRTLRIQMTRHALLLGARFYGYTTLLREEIYHKGFLQPKASKSHVYNTFMNYLAY